MKDIVFLTHLNRTGSTYLCKILDEYENIYVSLEASIPDGLNSNPVLINNINDIDTYINSLYKDIRFKDWNLDKNKIKEEFINNGFPLRYPKILLILLNLYFNGKGNVWIVKRGEYINNIFDIKKLFPQSKFIYIFRDPRAVYYSQKNSLSLSKNRMAKNPVFMVLDYLRIENILNSIKNDQNFYIIYYENLIKNKDIEINNLLNFLNVDSKVKTKKVNYFEKIPESQKYLHNNIIKEPISNNINKWENGLIKAEIKFINNKLKTILKKHNYPIKNIKIQNIKDITIYFYYNLLFNYLIIKRKIFNL